MQELQANSRDFMNNVQYRIVSGAGAPIGGEHLSSSKDDEYVLVSPNCQPGGFLHSDGTCATLAPAEAPHTAPVGYSMAFVALWLLVMLAGASLGWWRTWHACKKAERAHNDIHLSAQTLIAEMRTQICTQHAEIERLREEAKNVRIMSMMHKPTLVSSRITEASMNKIRDDHRRLATMQPTDPNLVALNDGTVYRWDARTQCWNLT